MAENSVEDIGKQGMRGEQYWFQEYGSGDQIK